jgi:sulfur-carrier protein
LSSVCRAEYSGVTSPLTAQFSPLKPESLPLGGASSFMKAMIKIHIPTPLRQYVGKQGTVEVQGGTVGQALSGLVTQHPDLRRHLYTDDGKLRAFVNVYLNDEDIRYLQKEDTTVKESDNISIVPSIAGGSGNIDEFSNLRIVELQSHSTMRCCRPSCCCCL